MLMRFDTTDTSLLEDLKKMGPSAIDMEMRSLGVEMGGSVELMQNFLQFILYLFSTKKHFEIVNAYLALFIKLHASAIADEDDLVEVLEKVKEAQSLAWTHLETMFNKNLCLISYLKSVT
jgi:U3 small nucleolar RNA-associated protein 21